MLCVSKNANRPSNERMIFDFGNLLNTLSDSYNFLSLRNVLCIVIL